MCCEEKKVESSKVNVLWYMIVVQICKKKKKCSADHFVLILSLQQPLHLFPSLYMNMIRPTPSVVTRESLLQTCMMS